MVVVVYLLFFSFVFCFLLAYLYVIVSHDICLYSLFGSGQGSALHSLVSTGFSEQDLPPYIGMGFVQLRVLDVIPPPQDSEHSVQFVHEVKPPFTIMDMKSDNVPRKNKSKRQ